MLLAYYAPDAPAQPKGGGDGVLREHLDRLARKRGA